MKYIFEIVSKAESTESVDDKHRKIVKGLTRIAEPWGIPEGEYPAPNFGTGITAIFNLNRLLRNGIKGDVIYSFRGVQSAEPNDRIYLEFNPRKVIFNELVNNVFKQYITFFEPYEACIFNKDIIFYDYENRGKNNPDTFFRVYQVFFWSQDYCMKKTNMSVIDLQSEISKSIEYSELFMNGLFVIVTSNLLTMEESNEINLNIKALL